eukprot:CAMPEP_0174856734 /NCGR_PEP_ID=MMETSP1114-20130205/36193_1 /TAXON_ID=312471 /ORGANISM="Neobodo designis, Strain CCAP 1951/1" /LENGTH=146 /DNA_ID=CAMNT_0016091539 /DNA_START=27 /DNA_END=463 /DNA_ORIENTATION=-
MPTLPDPPRSMKLKPSGEVDYAVALREQREKAGGNALASPMDYLKRTSTPRRDRPPPADPLSSGPVQYQSPQRPAAVTGRADAGGRPATAGGPAVRPASAALHMSELDFHLSRVIELLRRSDRGPLPTGIADKVHRIAAFDDVVRR